MTEQILEIILHHDIENRIKNPEICKQMKDRFDLHIDPPQVRDCVHLLRENNHPIGSDANGYFYARDRQELEHTKAQLMSRVTKIARAVRGLENCFARPEQIEMGL